MLTEHQTHFSRRSWTEIRLSALRENLRIYKEHCRAEEIMAVVKADAYGHGAAECAHVLAEAGVRLFAVSNIIEAIELRLAGVKGEILILGYTPAEQLPLLTEYDIMQAVVSEADAARIAEKAPEARVQYAIDTGMNRIGLDADDPAACEAVMRKYPLNLCGMFTHLCVADTDTAECRAFTRGQIAKFEAVADRVADMQLPYVHCLNSAGGLWQETKYNRIARLGIVMYGLKPDYANTLPEGIRPVLEWKSVISMVKPLHKGETVGYGRTFTAEHEMLLATVPTGYADGYDRLLSNRGYVLIDGHRAPVVGRVCMDQLTVDVTGLDVEAGDEVVLLGQSGGETYTADDMAQQIGTIGYEIICGITHRVQRKYL